MNGVLCYAFVEMGGYLEGKGLIRSVRMKIQIRSNLWLGTLCSDVQTVFPRGKGKVCICVIACVFMLFLLLSLFLGRADSFMVEWSLGEWIRGRHRCSAGGCCVCCAGMSILSLYPTFCVDGERLAQGMHASR